MGLGHSNSFLKHEDFPRRGKLKGEGFFFFFPAGKGEGDQGEQVNPKTICFRRSVPNRNWHATVKDASINRQLYKGIP